jgi:hypothetical protein
LKQNFSKPKQGGHTPVTSFPYDKSTLGITSKRGIEIMPDFYSAPIDVVKTVIHPLVKSMYLKKGISSASPENVLVIETNFNQQDGIDHDSDSYLMDLLIDLQDLKDRAEKEIGAVSRVDIRRH